MQTGFTRRAALLTIVALAWPTVLEQILTTAVSYVDTAMVGSIGARASAAIGATMTVNWLVNSSISALAIGFLSYISRALGANNRALAARAAMQAILAAIVAGAAFTVAALPLSKYVPAWMNADPDIRADASRYFFIIYTPMLFRSATIVFGTVLRASGDTKTPMLVNVVTNLVNVVLNFLLIYPSRAVRVFGLSVYVPGANLEVAGAAIASAIAFVIGGAWMTAMLFQSPVISPKGLRFRPDMEIIRPCLRVALPAALQRFFTSMGYVAFSSIINTLGAVSTAAHSIANTAESAFYIPGYGMQAAAATLAGRTVGEGDKEKLSRLTRMLLLLETLVMLVSGALLFVFAESMMRLFTPDEQVVRMGARVLRMVSLSEPVYGVAVILEGVFHGVGDTLHTFYFGVIGMWGVRILGTYICVICLHMDLQAAWACMIAHNLALGVMLCARYARGRWNPLNQRQSLQ